MLPLIEVVEQVHIGEIKQTPADRFDDFCVDKCRRFDTWVPTVLPLRRVIGNELECISAQAQERQR